MTTVANIVLSSAIAYSCIGSFTCFDPFVVAVAVAVAKIFERIGEELAQRLPESLSSNRKIIKIGVALSAHLLGCYAWTSLAFTVSIRHSVAQAFFVQSFIATQVSSFLATTVENYFKSYCASLVQESQAG